MINNPAWRSLDAFIAEDRAAEREAAQEA